MIKGTIHLGLALLTGLCALLLQSADASATSQTGPDEVKLVFEIGAHTVPCEGVAPMRCLIVNGECFYETIIGYQHVEGQSARICVWQVKRPEPVPADLGAFEYRRSVCDG